MELKAHFVVLFPPSDEGSFITDKLASLLQAVMTRAKSESNYSQLVDRCMELMAIRGKPDIFPKTEDAALRALLGHVCAECPDVRPLLVARATAVFPDLVDKVLPA